LKLWVCPLAPPELNQLAGLTVARFSANLRRCSAGGPRPNQGVLEGTFALCRPAQRGLCWRPIVAVVGQQERGRPMGFRIGSLYTRFVSMPQALWAALCEDGHEVIRPEDLQIRTRASGRPESVLAVLGDPHRCVEVGG
jgi:hypothetical protein